MQLTRQTLYSLCMPTFSGNCLEDLSAVEISTVIRRSDITASCGVINKTMSKIIEDENIEHVPSNLHTAMTVVVH